MNRVHHQQIRKPPGAKKWLGHWLDRGVMLAVRGYQRYVSPRKGYCCAHRVLHGGPSCSEYFRQAVGRHGSFRAAVLMKQRFADCRSASRHLQHIRRSGMVGEGTFMSVAGSGSPPPNRRRQHKLRRWASDMLTGCCTPADGSADCFGLEAMCGDGDTDSFNCGCENPCDCAEGWSCCD